MRAPLAALLALATAFAGCIGEAEVQPPPVTPEEPSGDEPPPDEPLNATSADPVVQHVHGSVAGAMVPDPVGLYLRAPGNSENRFDFELPAGAVAVVIEAVWNGSDPLDLLVDPPAEACASSDPAGLTAECPEVPSDRDGQSIARVVLEDPALLNLTGTWSFGLWARQSAQPVPFDACVTVFFAPPPADYSAFQVPA